MYTCGAKGAFCTVDVLQASSLDDQVLKAVEDAIKKYGGPVLVRVTGSLLLCVECFVRALLLLPLGAVEPSGSCDHGTLRH